MHNAAGPGKVRVAVDLMGGDNAPQAPIEACLMAARKGISILALGDRSACEALRARTSGTVSVEVQVCSQVITPDEPPVQAIREKEDSTIRKGLTALKLGQAGAFVSAGSTGALVAGGVVLLGRAPGVDKPCLGTVLPSKNGRGVFFADLGASSDVRPHTLVQFAVMADAYARDVLGWENPAVYLLNIGTEPEKGNTLTRKAFELLQRCPVRFCGNVEARDVFSGFADIVVTDGFTGNIFLKTCEGTSAFQMETIKRELTASPVRRLLAAGLRPAFRKVRELLDYTSYGGAPLLGLQGCVFKCHGSSDAVAMANGIEKAWVFAQNDVVARMSKILTELAVEGE